MARTRLRSGSMKISPEDIPHLVAAVKKATPKGLGLSERAFDYWIAGNLPKALMVLLKHPDVAAALYRDAETLALKTKISKK